MLETYQFLKKCGVFYLATVSDNKPHVRPFGALNVYEDKLYFQTGKIKKVAHQIKENPYVEISGFTEGKWIRLEGELVIDERVEAKISMLDNNPNLKSMYDANDDNTLVLYIKNATATIYSFSDEPQVLKF